LTRGHDIHTLPVAVAAAGLAAYWFPAVTSVARVLRRPLGIVDRTAADVALTFDDGPHTAGTPAVLELLRAYDVRATFFLVGEQVERRPALAAEIAAAGHAVGTHCHRHRSLLRLAPGQVRDDLDRAWTRVAEATGREPTLYRPPYGVLNAAALAIARRRGWTTMLWTRDGRDWERHATAESIAARVTAELAPGDVVLLHDADFYAAAGCWRATVAALPQVLESIAAHGLRPGAAQPSGR
jgi:peptidoglycan/xylan/chitin deacetylase (PgdA/CDA1 family)